MNAGVKCFKKFGFFTKAGGKNRGSFESFVLNQIIIRNFSCDSPFRMRFVQYKQNNTGGPQRLGVQLSRESDIVDISMVDSSIPNSLVEFLKGGEKYIEKAKRIVADGKSVISLDQVELLPPVTGPDKVVCVGLNYRGHCEEQNLPLPKEPCIFNKFPSVIVGPNSEVVHPPNTKALDWEVELAVIIGKQGKDIPKLKAFDYIFGYTVAQDITARDWQKGRNNGQWLLGKSMDTFCPLGPAVAMKEYLPDPHTLTVNCSINGVTKQNASTEELIFKVDDIVAYISHFFTLLPGDVILTGTPSGVGVFRNPREFLKPGDVIESEISHIGKMKNKVV